MSPSPLVTLPSKAYYNITMYCYNIPYSTPGRKGSKSQTIGRNRYGNEVPVSPLICCSILAYHYSNTRPPCKS